MICADTSFLLSLEGNDTNSPAATAHARQLNEAITITALNRLEVENAVRLLRFRGVVTAANAAATLAAFAADEAAGAIAEAQCSWPEVIQTARRISGTRTEAEGHRLMDIMLVAVALELGAVAFLSFDERQRKLAVAEGLAIGPP